MRVKNSNTKRKVLIADDSPDIAVRLAEAIGSIHGMQIVGPAADGPAALALFAAEKPDIAILDLQMPGMNGLEVVSSIRRHDQAAMLVILTTHDTPEYRRIALNKGANHFLSKTANLDRVADLIREYCES